MKLDWIGEVIVPFIVAMILCIGFSGCAKPCKFRKPINVINCGGATDINGITWSFRNLRNETEFKRKKDYRCDEDGYILEMDASCQYPRICDGCYVIKESAISIPEPDEWCADYTELYKELLKDKRRYNSLKESFDETN